jgi:hypothetical protein
MSASASTMAARARNRASPDAVGLPPRPGKAVLRGHCPRNVFAPTRA